MAARLGLEESTPLVYMERLRIAGAEPLALDKMWMPEAIAAPLLDVDFTRTALYIEYARLCGVSMTAGAERIRAVAPTVVEQRLLAITPDVALLAIERLGCSRGRPVEWRRTRARGDRFTVTADIVARVGYRLQQGDGGPVHVASTGPHHALRTVSWKEPQMTSTDPIAQIDPSTANDLAGSGALLLDVREFDEWRVGHIAGAVHVPLDDLEPESIPRDRVVVAMCRFGSRSGTAAIQLAVAGVDVRNMAGGMKALAEQGLPITTDDGASGTVG